MIRIHLFDYNAPSSLLNHSHSGFLSPAPSYGQYGDWKKKCFLCYAEREKSATKEATSILERYFRSLSGLNAEGFESLDANMSAKGMRISVSTKEELGSSLERKDAAL